MIKVSDYIAQFLVDHGIDTVFTVVGGGAMHMNDSFGHHPKLHCIYQHHEQACSMAAEGYAKASGRIAAVCVTSGPGAVNTLNGVVGAFQDSVPMIVFSGQVKSSLTVRNSGLPLRTLGGQEFDIVPALSNMTKYAEMVLDPSKIRLLLEKALHLAITGRPGPTWLDIPLDIQGAFVDERKLPAFSLDPASTCARDNKVELGNLVDKVAEKLLSSKRPVLYVGNGIRISDGVELFQKIIAECPMPVVTCWDSVDLIESDSPCSAGRGGTMGDRPGNFAVQNSDFILAIGNRLNIYQVGYDVSTWAREAYVVDVDIDPSELKKPTIRVDMPICADAKEFMQLLYEKIRGRAPSQWNPWFERIHAWKAKYPVVLQKHRDAQGKTNVYAFMDSLSRLAGPKSVTVVSNGSASVVGSQSYFIQKDQRFIMNCAFSSMGYGLPAAIGASVALGGTDVICIEGDGSIQMNVQELQTMVTNRLPIKLFVINNGGYHQIRLTQSNLFKNGLVGVGPESGDLGFPDYQKIAAAYGVPYCGIANNGELNSKIPHILEGAGPVLCEVFCDTIQPFEPKSSARRLEDGSIVSPPLEDMAPFLPKEELRQEMIIKIADGKGGK